MRTLACLLLITGCATEQLSTRTSAVTKPDVERMLCDPNACLVYRCKDSDGDAICDLDEATLATDPKDRYSRPDFRDVLENLRGLPSFQEGQSMLVVLPTVGPEGQPVFGGEAMLPARHDLLKQIGVELPAGMPDLRDGLTLVRSLESANVVAFSRPPWLRIEPPKPDTTYDSGIANTTVGGALAGLKLNDWQVHSSSSNDGLQFSTFSFTDQYGDKWSGSSQTGSTYGNTKIETHHKSDLDSSEFNKLITVATTVSDAGTTTTTHTTTTHSVSPDGKITHATKKTVMTTSADGREHVKVTPDGKVDWWIDGFEQQKPDKDNTGDFPEPADDGTAVAHSDPDYIEYVASPEVLDTVILMRGGPVQIVDPLSEEGQENYVPGLGNHLGPVSLIAPDAASNTSSEPMFIHMPFGGDYDPNQDEAPAPDGTYQGGQCLYCNQGGD